MRLDPVPEDPDRSRAWECQDGFRCWACTSPAVRLGGSMGEHDHYMALRYARVMLSPRARLWEEQKRAHHRFFDDRRRVPGRDGDGPGSRYEEERQDYKAAVSEYWAAFSYYSGVDAALAMIPTSSDDDDDEEATGGGGVVGDGGGVVVDGEHGEGGEEGGGDDDDWMSSNF